MGLLGVGWFAQRAKCCSRYVQVHSTVRVQPVVSVPRVYARVPSGVGSRTKMDCNAAATTLSFSPKDHHRAPVTPGHVQLSVAEVGGTEIPTNKKRSSRRPPCSTMYSCNSQGRPGRASMLCVSSYSFEAPLTWIDLLRLNDLLVFERRGRKGCFNLK